MKFLGKDSGKYIFQISSDESSSLEYAFHFGDYHDDFMTKFEENSVSLGIWESLHEEKIRPFYLQFLHENNLDDQDVSLAFTEDELLLLAVRVTSESLGLGSECDTLVGTPYEDVYKMTGQFIEILDDVISKDPKTDKDRDKRKYLDWAITFRNKMPESYT